MRKPHRVFEVGDLRLDDAADRHRALLSESAATEPLALWGDELHLGETHAAQLLAPSKIDTRDQRAVGTVAGGFSAGITLRAGGATAEGTADRGDASLGDPGDPRPRGPVVDAGSSPAVGGRERVLPDARRCFAQDSKLRLVTCILAAPIRRVNVRRQPLHSDLPCTLGNEQGQHGRDRCKRPQVADLHSRAGKVQRNKLGVGCPSLQNGSRNYHVISRFMGSVAEDLQQPCRLVPDITQEQDLLSLLLCQWSSLS